MYVVFLKSSLGVSKVQLVLKTTDSNNQQTDNKVLGIILTFLLRKNTKGSGPNDYFWMALKGGIPLCGWMDWYRNGLRKDRCQIGRVRKSPAPPESTRQTSELGRGVRQAGWLEQIRTMLGTSGKRG